jgi:hypothetical protein
LQRECSALCQRLYGANGRFWRKAVIESQADQFGFSGAAMDAAMSAPGRKADEGRGLFEFCFCEGFRMTADRDDAACTGAVVRNPPMKERA